jgi:phosphoglycolate phosphatase
LTGPRLHEGIRAFRDYYGSEGLLRFTKYPGVEEMLHELREDGYRLNIATSKLQIMAMEVVRCAGWANLFNVVGGAEADGSRHVKVDVIEWTLSQLGDRPQVVAMVGDRAADIEGARALGLVGIGVSWGYGSRHELSEAGAFSTTDSPDQLLKALRGFG